MSSDRMKASGVQDLVDRLREEGVAEGRREAAEVLQQARREAARIVEAARREAAAAVEEARRAASRFQAAGEEAVRLALRDAALRLRVEIEDRFAAQLGRLVSQRLADPQFLQRLLLGIAGQAVPQDRAIEIMLPETLLTPADGPSASGSERADVDRFVRGLAGQMLRQDVTLSVTEAIQAGVVIRSAEEGIEVHLDDRAVSELLREHLVPRFRALLDGGAVATEETDEGR